MEQTLTMPKPRYFSKTVAMLLNGTRMAFTNDSIRKLLSDFLDTLFETAGIQVGVKPGLKWGYETGVAVIRIPAHLLCDAPKAMWKREDVYAFLHEVGHSIVDFNILREHRRRSPYTTFSKVVKEEECAWEFVRVMLPISEHMNMLAFAAQCRATYTPETVANMKGWVVLDGGIA